MTGWNMAVSSGGKRAGLLRGATGAALVLMAATSAAQAQDAPRTVSIELNDMALELVLFEQDGRVNRFVVVRTAKVPTGKSRVRQFDIPDTACPSIARILINDVKECTGAGLTPGSCAESIKVATRTDMRFEN
jgi:hypothetical protein